MSSTAFDGMVVYNKTTKCAASIVLPRDTISTGVLGPTFLAYQMIKPDFKECRTEYFGEYGNFDTFTRIL